MNRRSPRFPEETDRRCEPTTQSTPFLTEVHFDSHMSLNSPFLTNKIFKSDSEFMWSHSTPGNIKHIGEMVGKTRMAL